MEFSGLQIINSKKTDLDFIFNLFDSAIAYQKKNGYDVWPQFSKQLILTEIKENRHWKIMNGNTIICIFSVLYNDPVIWKEKDLEPSVYLHRIAVNPSFKGKNSMALVKNWALDHAKNEHKKFVRMDTWGNNQTLKNYYINCGFNYIGQQQLDAIDGLPAHYGGLLLSLFQLEV